jgi:glutamine phosphoribosylpyrophosphate amidotransferase
MIEELDADSINYLPIDEYIKETSMRPDQLCLGCITDKYPTALANQLSEKMKNRLKEGAIEEGRIYEST